MAEIPAQLVDVHTGAAAAPVAGPGSSAMRAWRPRWPGSSSRNRVDAAFTVISSGPTRPRATLILKKGADHVVETVALRRL